MGVSHYDAGAATKRLETKYTLSTIKGVKSLLKDYHALHNRAYERGDMAAIDLLVDLDTAMQLAKLTDRQRAALTIYYIDDQDQEETAKRMGCDASTVSRHRKAGLERIKNIYQNWNYN